MASTTAIAAFSIIRIEGMPNRSVARRSTFFICSAVRIFMMVACRMQNAERRIEKGECSSFSILHSAFCIHCFSCCDSPPSQQLRQIPFAAGIFAGEALQITDDVDVVARRQYGHAVLRLLDAVERGLQHGIAAPRHVAKYRCVEYGAAAADQV